MLGRRGRRRSGRRTSSGARARPARSPSCGEVGVELGQALLEGPLEARRVVDLEHQLPGRLRQQRPVEGDGELAAEGRRDVVAQAEAVALLEARPARRRSRSSPLDQAVEVVEELHRVLEHEGGDQLGVGRDEVERRPSAPAPPATRRCRCAPRRRSATTRWWVVRRRAASARPPGGGRRGSRGARSAPSPRRRRSSAIGGGHHPLRGRRRSGSRRPRRRARRCCAWNEPSVNGLCVAFEHEPRHRRICARGGRGHHQVVGEPDEERVVAGGDRGERIFEEDVRSTSSSWSPARSAICRSTKSRRPGRVDDLGQHQRRRRGRPRSRRRHLAADHHLVAEVLAELAEPADDLVGHRLELLVALGLPPLGEHRALGQALLEQPLGLG